MDFVTGLINGIDQFLIAPYRWPENPMAGWWLGTSILALWSTLLGRLTMALVMRVNLRHVQEGLAETSMRHTQSMNALKAGNKEAYKAINNLANEAYGKTFFLQVAMAAASLWPIPLALGWLQLRFSDVRFPLPMDIPLMSNGVGYAFVFIPLYILVRILVAKVVNWMSQFRKENREEQNT
ncbi:MAG: hypothetical protein GY846_21100 [Deltaproteobacteria bacterium]|nr:hypothetical protein [Deltaproteobacteria bacterium]